MKLIVKFTPIPNPPLDDDRYEQYLHDWNVYSDNRIRDTAQILDKCQADEYVTRSSRVLQGYWTVTAEPA